MGILAITAYSPKKAAAQTDYTWIRTPATNNSWRNFRNWSPATIADHFPHLIGDSATFNLNTATDNALPVLNEPLVTISALIVNAAPASTNFGLTIGSGAGGSGPSNTLAFAASSGNATYTENADPTPGTGATLVNTLVSFDSDVDAHVAGKLTFANVVSGNGGLTIDGAGTVQLSADNTYQGSTTVNAGRLLVTNTSGSGTGAGAVFVNAGGTLGGTGAVTGATTLTGGKLSPGLSAGTLTLGTTSLDSASILEYELDAPNVVGTGSDLTVVNGDLTLDGTINVAGLANFAAGTYRLFDVTGTITDHGLSIGTLPASFSASIALAANQVNLVVSQATNLIPGDFDGDGDVDGADFVAWQTNFPTSTGATLAQGDADGDGDVDGADFVVWQTHFPTSPGGAAAPVPEPDAACQAVCGGMLLLALVLFQFRRHKLQATK